MKEKKKKNTKYEQVKSLHICCRSSHKEGNQTKKVFRVKAISSSSKLHSHTRPKPAHQLWDTTSFCPPLLLFSCSYVLMFSCSNCARFQLKVWTDVWTRIESPGNRIDQKGTLGSLQQKKQSNMELFPRERMGSLYFSFLLLAPKKNGQNH